MGLFSKIDQGEDEYRYSPKYWDLFRTHREWTKHQEAQKSRALFRSSIGCTSDGRTAKWCAHCRLNDREQATTAPKPVSNSTKRWNTGLPYSRAFRDCGASVPKYGAKATQYERMVARHCDVPLRFVIDLTRGTADTRAFTMDEIIEEAKNNCTYKMYVVAIMRKRFSKKLIFPEKEVHIQTPEISPSYTDNDTRGFVQKIKLHGQPRSRVVPVKEDIQAPVGLRKELVAKCKLSVEYLLYKQQLTIKTIRQILKKYGDKARDVFLSYKNKEFGEILKEERIKRWNKAVDKTAKTPEQAAIWKSLYHLKPIREIIMIEKHLGNFGNSPNIGEFTRKVRYFKDNGVIARATPGKTLDEVIAKRKYDQNKQRVDNFFFFLKYNVQ